MLEQQIGYCLDVVEVDHGHLCLRQRDVRRNRHNMRIFRMNERLAVCRTMNFQLGKRVALETLDQHQIDR